MARELLTDLKVKSLRPDATRQIDIWDARLTGFGLRISPSGTKAFQVIYRIGSRSRRHTLGRYPTLSLSDARKLAHAALRDVGHGTDPAATKLDLRRDPHSFETFVATFIETYARQKNKSWRETDRLLKREFVAIWGKRDIRQITKADVLAVLDRIMKRDAPIAANRSLAAIKKLFNWAIERGELTISPCAGLKAPGKISSRDRVLEDAELGAIWAASNQAPFPFGVFVRMLVLTGQRRGEVAGMRWPDVDLNSAAWSLPAAQTKAKRAHVVPLSPSALALLHSIPRTSSEYVFPARGKSVAMTGFNKRKKQIDSLSGVTAWTLHDIRRTVASGLARLKTPPHVVERILNHTTGTLGGVAGVYNRFAYLDAMREALGTWAKHVEKVTR